MHLKAMVCRMFQESANQLLLWKIQLYIAHNLKIADVQQKMNMLFLLFSKKFNSSGSLMKT